MQLNGKRKIFIFLFKILRYLKISRMIGARILSEQIGTANVVRSR